MVPADLNVPQALCPRLKLLPLQPQLSQHPPDLVRPRRRGGLEVLKVEDEDVGTADADPVAEDLKPLAGENDRGEKEINWRREIEIALQKQQQKLRQQQQQRHQQQKQQQQQ